LILNVIFVVIGKSQFNTLMNFTGSYYGKFFRNRQLFGMPKEFEVFPEADPLRIGIY
jgi:hypothetical protein